MEFELWWLLVLPLFFGLGWLAARVDIRHVMSESRSVPASYFRGLNYLLNEQPDRAIEAFIEVVKVDSDTVDLHFALGGLFRKRGEIERAIRMHQNLVEREDLSPERQLKARFELGQDYLKAGLLDRAEAIFGVLQQGEKAEEAQRFLLEIFVQERDWGQALMAARALSKVDSRSYQIEIAQFLCELATDTWLKDQVEVARDYLRDALSANRICVRANMLLGDIASARGEHEEAIAVWRRIELQDVLYLSLVAERLILAYREIGKEREGLQFLQQALTRQPSQELCDIVFSAVLRSDGAQAALQLAQDFLRRMPSLRNLDHVLEAQILLAAPEQQLDLQSSKQAVQRYIQAKSAYVCEHCGFRARNHFWRCPACGRWESFLPNKKEEN